MASRTPTHQRKAGYKLGQRAERWAAWYLRLRGYRIVQQRYKTPVGEIDLIARKAGTLVFVEVKARANLDAALGSVSPKSQQRIRRAAQHFISARVAPGSAVPTQRFDVIAILPRSTKGLGWLPRVTHLTNVF